MVIKNTANTWPCPIEDGRAMIDTGYKKSYQTVLKNSGKGRSIRKM